MTAEHPTSSGYYLPPDDPNYRQWAAAVQVEPDPRVLQMSGALVANCPREYRGDSARCVEYLSGPNTAAVIQAVVASAERDAAANVARAEVAKDELIRANRELEALNADRAKLPTAPVDGPHGRRVTPAENRIQLAQTQRIVHQREVANDDEHRKTARTPVAGHIAAVVAAVVETTFTVRVFNVSITHFSLIAFLPWLAATVGLAVFNAKVGEWLGRKRRTAREIERSAVELNTRALAAAHARGAR